MIPIRPIRGRWPKRLEQSRLGTYFRPNPATILNDNASPQAFRETMDLVRIGGTFKTTCTDRHPEADAFLLKHLDLTDATIVDLGASDGSTSLDLIRRLPAFRAYLIADLHMNITATTMLGHTLLYDADGECILVFGRRCVAWPELSRTVQAMYRPLLAAAKRRPRATIPLLNPDVRALMAADPRITARVHDLFRPWPGQRPDVIKIANLLRRVYFSDADISRGLKALLGGLPDGGHLFMVENPFENERGTRIGLYRRTGDHFVVHATTDEPPEIHDLVLQTGRAHTQPVT